MSITTPPLVTFDDVADRLGDPIDDIDANRLDAAIDDASALVRTVARQTWLNDAETAVEDVPDAIVTVVANVARRGYRNPLGIVHETEGPFSARYGEDAAQGIYLTDAERELVESFRTTSGLWSMRTSRDDATSSSVDWWEVEGAEGPTPTEGIVPREPA